MSWWRMILWALPSLFTMNMQRNVFKLSSRTVSKIHLMQDGETVQIETILSHKLRLKNTVKISDLRKNDDPEG